MPIPIIVPIKPEEEHDTQEFDENNLFKTVTENEKNSRTRKRYFLIVIVVFIIYMIILKLQK